MAKIIENPSGGRRSIRLNADDVAMVITAYQLRTKGIQQPSIKDLRNTLGGNPIVLPEEM